MSAEVTQIEKSGMQFSVESIGLFINGGGEIEQCIMMGGVIRSRPESPLLGPSTLNPSEPRLSSDLPR